MAGDYMRVTINRLQINCMFWIMANRQSNKRDPEMRIQRLEKTFAQKRFPRAVCMFAESSTGDMFNICSLNIMQAH